MVGYNSADDYANKTYKPLFAVEFIGDETAGNFTSYLHNLTVMIYYNSSYTDYPSFY